MSTPAGGPFVSNSFSWAQGTGGSPTEIVTGTDGASNNAQTTLTFANDVTAPSAGALTVNGIAASAAGTSSTSSTGSFPIDVRTDYAETQTSTQSGLASSTLTRAAATLSANSCGTFGSPVTISGNPAQTLANGCYLFTLTGTDNVGNTVSVSTTVEVDTTAPSSTLPDPGSPVRGSVSLGASASDSETGVQQVTFQYAPAGTSGIMKRPSDATVATYGVGTAITKLTMRE